MGEQNWIEALTAPFDPADVDFKPQTMSKDGTKALAIAFVDPRRYQERLSAVLGAGNWSVEYRPLGERAIIARLTLNTPEGDVVREDVGEFDEKGLAQYPTASAQAFKRACVTLGIGRYLYDLPQTWVSVENRRIPDNELARLRNQLPKPKAQKPAPAGTSAPAPANTGATSVPNARAIQRILDLTTSAKAMGLQFKLPENWRQLGYDELVSLGKSISAEIKSAQAQEEV